MVKKEKEKKKLPDYKTHGGPKGSPAQWEEAARQALMLENPKATMEEIEIKLTKLGMRKIQL